MLSFLAAQGPKGRIVMKLPKLDVHAANGCFPEGIFWFAKVIQKPLVVGGAVGRLNDKSERKVVCKGVNGNLPLSIVENSAFKPCSLSTVLPLLQPAPAP